MSKQYFLSEVEFELCCAAAEIKAVPCFQQGEGDLPEGAAEAAVWCLSQRKLLRAEEDGKFVLCRELSDSFRTIRDSRTVLLIRKNQQLCNLPYCIAYGNSRFLVSLQPGIREEDYVGLTLYQMEDIDEWLEDVGLALQGNMPDDLLETAENENMEDEIPPEVEQFLAKYTWPSAGVTEPAENQFPEEIVGCVDFCDPTSMELRRRLYLVRLPVFDRLISGSADGIEVRMYRLKAMGEVVRQMLSGEKEE